MLAGFHVDGLDQTGLSQKAGPVVSDLSLTAADQPRRTNLVGRGQADLLLAFDLLTAASDPVVGAATHHSTALVASLSTTPVGRQISNPALDVPDADALMERLTRHVDPQRIDAIDAEFAAQVLVGSKTAAHILLLGVAVQFGALPLPVDAAEQAIRLNGVAVDRNLAAFTWGRRWVADRALVEHELARRSASGLYVDTVTVPDRLARRIAQLALSDLDHAHVGVLAADLVGYQNKAYAERFLTLVERSSATGDAEFTGAVARSFHKLLAYKDEYEVARLMRSSDGLAPAAEVTGGPLETLRWHLHPPSMRAAGFDRKLRFRNRSAHLFDVLASGKRLRGTPLDPFGRTELRRLERQLPVEYESAIDRVAAAVANNTISVEQATEIACLPDQVRGYEDLKMRRADQYRAELERALAALP
jgi:indolepyruvate ferredoxin oxidoreductase